MHGSVLAACMYLLFFQEELVLPPGWVSTAPSDDGNACYSLLSPGTSTSSAFVKCSLLINKDYTWHLFVHSHPLPEQSFVKAEYPIHLDNATTSKLLQRISSLHPCPGNPESKFVLLAKSRNNGKFLSHDGEVVAYLDSIGSVVVDGQSFCDTVRTINCQLLTSDVRCQECKCYRKNLTAQHSRAVHTASAQRMSSKVNYRLEQHAVCVNFLLA